MRRELAIAAGAAGALALFLGRQPLLKTVAMDVDAMKNQPAPIPPRNAELISALENSNVRGLLAAIRWAEGTAGPDGYRTLFGGGLFDDFSDHPRRVVAAMLGGKLLKSSAAGAYQILRGTWDGLHAPLALPDFSPRSQDIAAVELIRRRGALQYAMDGRFALAVDLIRKEWASMPGAGYGQPEKKLAALVGVYRQAGGAVA